MTSGTAVNCSCWFEFFVVFSLLALVRFQRFLLMSSMDVVPLFSKDENGTSSLDDIESGKSGNYFKFQEKKGNPVIISAT